MAKKHKHEDHINHEAWAIPYGDLMTLLLAFFVVMYAVSSVNEGRYRVLADSLSQAFGGPPKSMKPIQIGDKPEKGSQSDTMFNTPNMRGFEREPSQLKQGQAGTRVGGQQVAPYRAGTGGQQLQKMADAVQAAMKDLIDAQLVIVRRSEQWLEIEFRTDILFASGDAQLAPGALPVLKKLADILKSFEQSLRVEGHTDNRPIATSLYPSNWELSAARAASVVHLFTQSGVAPQRMSVVGYGEYHPIGDNADAEGRNRNRRVVIAVAASEQKNAVEQAAVDEAPGADGEAPPLAAERAAVDTAVAAPAQAAP